MVSGGLIQTSGYRLTTDALHFASCVLSSREESIPLWAIRDADLVEPMFQKARGVSDLHLILDPQYRGSFGQEAVTLRSIRDGRAVREMILGQTNAVRRYWAEQQQRRTVEAAQAGAARLAFNESQFSQAAAPRQADGDDLLEKLTRLGELKSQGLLSDEEFAAAKAKLLGL